MQVKKVAASSIVGGSMIAMAIVGMGTASASTDEGPGQVTVTKSTTVTKTSTNILDGNKILNGNKILSGNRTTVKLEVNLLNGAFSNNILNTGASSFNNHSFNTHTVTVTKTIDSNNTTTLGQPGHK